MANNGHGARRVIKAGTVLDPTNPVFDLTDYVTDISDDESIDQEEDTSLGAARRGGAKSFLYGNNGETGEIQVNFDKQGAVRSWYEDIKAQGVEDSDFNIWIFDYPFGDATGSEFISRPVKLQSRRASGGINSKYAGSIGFQRSGEAITGSVS